MPSTIFFFGSGIFLTVLTGFPQIRALPRFFRIISRRASATGGSEHEQTINPFHALFTAMGTTIGMGNMVGPTIAIMLGGPSALVWLVMYIFFGAATKLSEVVFAIRTRVVMKDGYVIGGPMQYLESVSPILALWYTVVILFMFAGWSSIQANTLATIYALESVPQWVTGCALVAITLTVLRGGAQRVGVVASKLVPIMVVLYLSFFVWTLVHDFKSFIDALALIVRDVLSPRAAMGGLLGGSLLQSMRIGIYRGIHITESGIGVSSIPHAIAHVNKPIDQGILALFSAAADILLSLVSGLTVLMTGVWKTGLFRSTLIYEAFSVQAPGVGSVILLASVSLFVLTTVIGNSFNGIQAYATLTNHRWGNLYLIFTGIVIFWGSIAESRLAWEISDTLITLVAVPNLIGLLILACRNPLLIRYNAKE